MKFMLIMQGTPSAWETMVKTWTQAEFMAHVGFMKKLNEELIRSGEFVLAEGLDVPGNARIVSAKKADAPTVSDGQCR